MTRRTERLRAERAAAELEQRKQALVERRQCIPHTLTLRLKAARTEALRVGRPAR